MITLPLSYFWDFFARRGRMYLLWSSSLFSMYQTVEAMTLGTTMGLCCLHFSSALLTYSLASCWMQDFPMSYGNALWEDRESRASSALRSPSHLLFLVGTQLWSSGFNPERGQCAKPLFRSSRHARPLDVFLTQLVGNLLFGQPVLT